MNKRITIVSDTEVRIQRNGYGFECVTKLDCRVEPIHFLNKHNADNTQDGGSWDAEGRAALRDCINCLEATGDFAALSDESAVPFVGKEVRITREQGVWRVTNIDEWRVIVRSEAGGSCMRVLSELLPLTAPKPSVRPLSPQHWFNAVMGGKRLKFRGEEWLVAAASNDQVQLQPFGYGALQWFGREELAREGTWSHDGTPCGTISTN